MKKLLANLAFLAGGLLAAGSLNAQDDHKMEHKKEEPKFRKTKNFSKSYSLSANDKIVLDNKFGEMKLTTWDKNEVKVDITIAGKSDDEARAQEILDHISIDEGKDGGKVHFETKFNDDKEKKSWNKDNKEKHNNDGMEINYAVYLPAGNPLEVTNQFGPMIVPDYKGEATIESKFGTLTAGRITNAKIVSVEFGEGNIAQVSGGKLSIKFSSGTVSRLTGDVKSNLEFSQVKLNLDNDLKSLDVNNSYSTVYLDLNKSLSASYDISTSYGEFSNKSNFTIREDGRDNDGDGHHGPRFNHRYSGSSGNGGAKISIKSSFGEIVAGHDLQVDLKKKKLHNKTRTV